MEPFSYAIYDTASGVQQLQMSPSSGGWAREIGVAAGGQSHTFQLADGDPGRYLPRAQWRALTVPWNRTLTVEQGGVVIYAGLITGRPYSFDNHVLTLKHSDIWTILRDRFPFGTGSYAGGTFVAKNLSWRAIAGRIVQAACSGPRPIYALPIVLPDLNEIGPYELTIENFHFQTAYDALMDIQATAGGPEIDFQPRKNAAGNLEYLMRVGSAAQPRLSGVMAEFHMSATRNQLTGVTVDEDAMKQITGMFVVGEGSEVDMVVGGLPVGSEPTPQIIARDAMLSKKHLKTEAEAANHAIAATAALIGTTKQTDVTYVVDPEIADVKDLVLGSTFRLHYRDDFFLPDGYSDLRMVGLSGDTSAPHNVKPILQGVS